MKNNKSMQVAPGDSNSTTAVGAGAEGGVVRDDLSEGDLASIVGGWNQPRPRWTFFEPTFLGPVSRPSTLSSYLD